MGKCVCCGSPTVKTVYDRGMCDDVALCENCREERFAQCSVCGDYFYREDMKNGRCEYCREV